MYSLSVVYLTVQQMRRFVYQIMKRNYVKRLSSYKFAQTQFKFKFLFGRCNYLENQETVSSAPRGDPINHLMPSC